MKFALRSALAALLYFALTFISHAQQISQQLAQKAPDAATLVNIAAQNGYVRVIVEFAGPVPGGQLQPDPAVIADVKSRVAASQDAIIASHFGSAANPNQGQGFPRGLLRFEITPGFAVNVNNAELNSLAADPSVVRITQDRVYRPSLLQSVPLVGMPSAYASGGTGLNQAVAVLDTGVQSDHEFLTNKVLMEACFSNSSGTGRSLCGDANLQQQFGTGAASSNAPNCDNEETPNLCAHGTHVAGIAAGNNTNPVAGGQPPNGIAKHAKIVAVEVFTRFDTDSDCAPSAPPCTGANDSDLISALDWVFMFARNPAPGVKLAAVNMSLGGGSFPSSCDDEPIKTPIDNLRGVGVVTIIAAGNDGLTNAISSPACISTAVAVASSDKSDKISSFTNMSAQVALMAPGGDGSGACPGDILSSVSASPPATNVYRCFSGTSMAAPHVAGAFAAIRSACPNATVDQILAALNNTGLPITDTRTGGMQTKPRIRVDLAVQQLACSSGPRTATHDFNNDSKSDVLWYNTTSGQVVNWLLNSSSIIGGGFLGSAANPPWAIVGQRDFNGDGRADILWRNGTTGQAVIWFINGTTVIGGGSPGSATTDWSVAGTGDFNGDGFGDVLWYNAATGQAVIWLLNGASVIGGGSPGLAASPWTIAGTGDFNADGFADILWYNTTNGAVVIWLLQCTMGQNGGCNVTGGSSPGSAPSPWTIVGTGDSTATALPTSSGSTLRLDK